MLHLGLLIHTLQNGLPSTLLNLIVVKGEVRVIPVTVEKEHCPEMQRLWQTPLLLKEGDAGQ